MSSTLEDSDSEIADIALEAPTLLAMILNAELSFKAPDTEINFLIPILQWNLT